MTKIKKWFRERRKKKFANFVKDLQDKGHYNMHNLTNLYYTGCRFNAFLLCLSFFELFLLVVSFN